MSAQNLCPICSSDTEVIQSAFISPWVRELGSLQARRSRYRVCVSCKSGFFDYRYTDSEMSRIYGGYRDPHYLAIRQSWEPSYTAELNDALGNDLSVLRHRHDLVLDAIAKGKPESSEQIKTAVDVGGDRGQFIPSGIPSRFVLDVSNKQVAPGVSRIATFEDAASKMPELIMACGILEHLSDPVSFVRQLTSIGSVTRSMLLYFEVPDGVPQRRPLSNRIVGYSFGLLATRFRELWRVADVRSAQRQMAGRGVSKLMPLRQSEHINFFSEDGLRSLASAANLEILLLDKVDIPSSLLKDGRLQFSRTLRLLVEPTAS